MNTKLLLCSVLILIPLTAYSAVIGSHFTFVQASPFNTVGNFDLGGSIYNNTLPIVGGLVYENTCYVDSPSSSAVLTFGFNFQGSGNMHYSGYLPFFDQDEKHPSWDFTGADHYEDYLLQVIESDSGGGSIPALWDDVNFPCEFWYTDPWTMGERVTEWSFTSPKINVRYF